ncbi:putative mediator complex subunit 6 [Paramicrosporidium saccamoebae]|uniref:Mediator of RNA polymerase II transcription subunit 6 n=1 Tax=Paramicrosporidium saccamoebae TaxID=1246581 RepID=A0A2H9TNC5_9FUNG|nr:putative mediator complex subunit 6 [Paramicrosporidium saccamoebae]
MEELAYVCFRDVAWLQAYPLTEASVLDYFSLSQFYERTCNNEVLKMQARYTDNAALLSQLHKMTGTEFAVVRSTPPKLFVIAKQQRHSSDKVSVLSVYYILNGSIFMAPSLYAVVGNRITASLHHLGEAIDYAKGFLSFDAAACQYVLPTTQADSVMTEEDLRLDRLVMEAVAEE